MQARVGMTMEFAKPDKPVTFGVGLSFGGG